MKTIEDHGKKQVEALENLKPVEGSKAIKYGDESLEQNKKLITNYLMRNLMRYKS